MDLHHGEIVERVIRRNGYSISEIARFAKVNRRSVYYWFNQKYLKAEIIHKIGLCIKHDFSIEFPEMFSGKEFENIKNFSYSNNEPDYLPETADESYWKDKYIEILEKYNEILLKNAEQNLLRIFRE